MSERVNGSASTLGYKAFLSIAYAIPQATSQDDVYSLFSVLSGEKPISEAISLIPDATYLSSYIPHHDSSSWKTCTQLCDWWQRPNHLSKL